MPQQHNSLEVVVQQEGHNQKRLPEELIAQEWQDSTLMLLTPPILQFFLL